MEVESLFILAETCKCFTGIASILSGIIKPHENVIEWSSNMQSKGIYATVTPTDYK